MVRRSAASRRSEFRSAARYATFFRSAKSAATAARSSGVPVTAVYRVSPFRAAAPTCGSPTSRGRFRKAGPECRQHFGEVCRATPAPRCAQGTRRRRDGSIAAPAPDRLEDRRRRREVGLADAERHDLLARRAHLQGQRVHLDRRRRLEACVDADRRETRTSPKSFDKMRVTSRASRNVARVAPRTQWRREGRISARRAGPRRARRAPAARRPPRGPRMVRASGAPARAARAPATR